MRVVPGVAVVDASAQALVFFPIHRGPQHQLVPREQQRLLLLRPLATPPAR